MLTRRSRGAHEDGVTLVELLVVLVLLGVVGSIVTTVVVTGLRTSTATTNRTEAIHDVERSLQRVIREVRVADPLYVAEDDPHGELAVAITRAGEDQLVRFQVDRGARQLRQVTQDLDDDTLGEIGDPVGPGSVALVTELDNALEGATPEQPVFTYYDAWGEEIDCQLGPDGRPTAPSSCKQALSRARQVGVRIVKEVTDARPIDAESVVTIRSIRYREAAS